MLPLPFVRRRGLRTLSAIILLALPACIGSSSDGLGDEPEEQRGDGGVGFGCGKNTDCRAGLVCGSKAQCELGKVTPEGSRCAATGECKEGLYCAATKLCAPGGAADVGQSCTGDQDCKAGLRCNPLGFGAVCQQGGTYDAGQSCKSNAQCLSGLSCQGGQCSPGITGVPALAGSWAGTKCEQDTNTVAYFRAPRGGMMTGDFYQLPYPNDVRVKAGKVDLTGHPTPGAELSGFDPVDRYLRAIEQGEGGFGAYPTVTFRFSKEIDVDTFRAPNVITFIDVTEGAPEFGQARGVGWFSYGGQSKYACSNFLSVRPGQGEALTPGHRYAVIITTDGKAKGGAPFAQDPDLAALLGDAAPGDAALKEGHTAYGGLRAYLKSKGIPATAVLNATSFTVANVTAPIDRIAKAVSEGAPAVSSGWVKCSEAASPCSDVTGKRACGEPSADFDELHALITLPIYQTGTAPYLDPDQGGDITYEGDKAKEVRREQVCVSLTVPKGKMPDKGYPLVIYAHGTGGSYRSHIEEGVAAMLSKASAPGGEVGFAVLGIDQVQHGPRRGQSTETPENLFFNFGNPKAALGNPLQGAADQLSLARMVADLEIAAGVSPTGSTVKFDSDAILFWGHSQGATEGSIAMPLAPQVKGVVLSGQGASLIDSLTTKSSPINIAAVLPFVLQDVDPQNPGKLIAGIQHPVLGILQQYIDPADPVHHAARLAAAPAAGMTGKHVFQVYGKGDTFSTAPTQATYALAARLGLVPADKSAEPPDQIGGLVPLSLPLAGNLSIGMQTLTAAVRQYGPAADYDGHFVAFRHDGAKADVARFLAGVAKGEMPQVGE